MIAGVASGVAEQFDLDPSVVRVAFVVLGLLLGVGITVYLLAWFLLPDDDGALPVQRAIRDHDTGSIILGVVTAMSLLSSPRDDGGWWHVIGSALAIGAVAFLVTRRGRRGSRGPGAPGSAPAATGDPASTPPDQPVWGSTTAAAGSAPAAPAASAHGSPTRGGERAVFDPVTGRWVPALSHSGWSGGVCQGRPAAPAPPSRTGPYDVLDPAGSGRGASAQPTPTPTPTPAPAPAPAQGPIQGPTRRPGLGAWATLLVLTSTAIIGAGAAWGVQAAALAASPSIVGVSAALACLSIIVFLLGMRGRRATALAVAVVLLVPFAAGLARVEAPAGGPGVSIEIGP